MRQIMFVFSLIAVLSGANVAQAQETPAGPGVIKLLDGDPPKGSGGERRIDDHKKARAILDSMKAGKGWVLVEEQQEIPAEFKNEGGNLIKVKDKVVMVRYRTVDQADQIAGNADTPIITLKLGPLSPWITVEEGLPGVDGSLTDLRAKAAAAIAELDRQIKQLNTAVDVQIELWRKTTDAKKKAELEKLMNELKASAAVVEARKAELQKLTPKVKQGTYRERL